jgi:osmotically-inducible protein OsmY
MKQTIINLMLGGGIALSSGGIAADPAAGPKHPDAISEQVSDAHHEMEILTALGRDPLLHAFDFSVSVDVGTVVLGGTVDNRVNKDLAEKIALGMGGIKFVVNHIVVEDTRSQHESDQERE